jgi:hypothetical protein
MKKLYLVFLFIFLITFSKYSSAQNTFDFEVSVDSSCGGNHINQFKVNITSNHVGSTIRYRGDSIYLDYTGNYSDSLVRNFNWIFFSKNGIGVFPVEVTVTTTSGETLSKTVNVINAIPEVSILANSPVHILKNSDTLFFSTKFLSSQLVSVNWIDITDENNKINLGINDKLPLQGFQNGNYKIAVNIEDKKGCEGTDTISFMLNTVGINHAKFENVLIQYNAKMNKITVVNLDADILELIDLNGRFIQTINMSDDKRFYLHDLKAGIYIIKSGDYRNKIIIQ